MHAHGLLIGGERGHQAPIGRRGGVRVDNREKIVAFEGPVARPGEQVVTRGGPLLLLPRSG